ncbi:hypothetical protein [Salinicoccus sp. HZC-1]|uniref:hypothetical protein n=1 Tax=Salinicoccus sp. HZC-1 TaxID=3385497 RepID=UPI00398B2A32
MDMHQGTIEIAEQWIELCNSQDIEGLASITSEELEVHGPKGTTTLNKEDLKEWMERANLKLENFEAYARDNKAIMGQHGTWLNEDDSVKGEQEVYTVLVIEDQKVSALARFDDKEQAFDVSGLEEADKIN